MREKIQNLKSDYEIRELSCALRYLTATCDCTAVLYNFLLIYSQYIVVLVGVTVVLFLLQLNIPVDTWSGIELQYDVSRCQLT